MKFFKKKYQYILPMLCVASFSAQATNLTEPDLSDTPALRNNQEKLVEDATLINNQSEDFKNNLYKDKLLKAPALEILNIRLRSLQANLKDSEECFNAYGPTANNLKAWENCHKSINETHDQITLSKSSLIQGYEKARKAN